MGKTQNAHSFLYVLITLSYILSMLEVLNIYNCKRYYCILPFGVVLFLTLLISIFCRTDHFIDIPIIITYMILTVSFVYWDLIDYDARFTRHRTEYYLTHGFAASSTYILSMWILFYIYACKHIKRILLILNFEHHRHRYDNNLQNDSQIRPRLNNQPSNDNNDDGFSTPKNDFALIP